MKKEFSEENKAGGAIARSNNSDLEIDLFELFYYFRTKLALIIAAFVVGATVAGLYTYFFIDPLYTATAKIYVVSSSSDTMVDLTDLNLGTGLSTDYEQVIRIRPIVNKVIDDLGLEYTYDELSEMIEISTIKNTRILTIDVTSTDPYEAEQIANAIAEQAETQVPKLMDTPRPHIIEPAIVPMFKSSPSFSKNIMLGALGATAVVLVILTGIFILQDSVNSADDIERMFGSLPLAVIPECNIGELNGKSNKRHKKIRVFEKRKEAVNE